MSTKGSFRFDGVADPDLTAVYCNDAVHVIGRSSPQEIREAVLDTSLNLKKQGRLLKTKNNWQAYAVVQPAGPSGPTRLRVFVMSPRIMECYTPDDGKTHKVNMPIDSDPSHTTYRLCGRPQGVIVVATSESMGHPNELMIYACSWDELEDGKALVTTYVPIVPPYATKNGQLTLDRDQHVAVGPGDGGEFILASLHGTKERVIAELPLARLIDGPTWTVLSGVTGILDLDINPDGGAYATCLHKDGLHLWERQQMGEWKDLGNPTGGAVPTADRCDTVFIPGASGSYERALILRTDTSDTLTTWFGEPASAERSAGSRGAVAP